MDFQMRCNSLQCRAELTDRAVVTTCCHILCEECTAQTSLAGDVRSRRCPICDTILSNDDDAVTTSLNPSEDYKTSVLSGFSPTVIMECANRGMAFYQYQTAQELIYQNHLVRSITDRYTSLSTHLDAVIGEANKRILSLDHELKAALSDRAELERKHQDLIDAHREKCKSQQQLQSLYQKLKSRVNVAAVEDAAARNVDNVLHHAPDLPAQRLQPAHVGTRVSPNILGVGPVRGATPGSGQNSHGLMATPVRQPYIGPSHANIHSALRPVNTRPSGLGASILDAGVSRRSPRHLDSNIPSGGHGLSSRIRTSRHAGRGSISTGRFAGIKNLGGNGTGLR